MSSIILMKLGIAGILGLILGIEREMKKKPVGLKTSLVISIVSCLLTIVSIEGAEIYAESYSKPMDPYRLAAQVVSGIGFLGAGVILRRGNDYISGLTTAAMIWGAAGIGIAVGAGFYLEATVVSILILVSVQFIPIIVKWIGPAALREKEIRIKMIVVSEKKLTTVLQEMNKKSIKVNKVKVKDLDDGNRKMDLIIFVSQKRYTTDVYYDVKEIEGVINVEIESLT
ncbi:MgtC/SapB transporter [Lottiidibacillus patelloidae]|uniref:MgtC/SapB transporter n=1 Tax=Lottiidibacillus patelloidae TaxID=2670334 RepID=A0A263BUK5_9BACI|nr:MgtC/SapB family protein [Lottiidibacillus patelloidae]OZM57423.1 MgtC/SapB transporter [Lottiidibacillus patelloidae]